jgi:tetratricopeptide (TPR) repeat protein
MSPIGPSATKRTPLRTRRLGPRPRARVLWQLLSRAVRTSGLPASDELTALVLYADAAVQTGDVDASSILYERIEPFADQIDWNGTTWGHARMYLGLLAGALGKHEQADQHLAFACDFQEANGMLLSAARAHLGWAEALAARGDAAGAREHAARALQLAHEHGYGLFERRAALSSRRSPRPRPTVAEPRCCPTRLLGRGCELLSS